MIKNSFQRAKGDLGNSLMSFDGEKGVNTETVSKA